MRWLDPKLHIMPSNGSFIIAYIEEANPKVCVGSIHDYHFKNYFEYNIFYDNNYRRDICYADDSQYIKYCKEKIKAWIPLPEPPVNIYGEINAVHPEMTYDEKSKMLTVKEGNDIIYSANVEGHNMMEFCLIAQEAYRKYKQNKDSENNG